MLYVRQKNLKSIAPWYKVRVETKLGQGVGGVEWAVRTFAGWGKAVWVVADGAYAKLAFLRQLLAMGVVVVSRLRKDAALWSVPPIIPPGQRKRGKPRTYGKDKISLAKRAGHRHGWQIGDFVLYGVKVRKKYKTFLATYKPVGGVIRVVLLKELHGSFAYFCTKAEATVQEILEAVADRAAIEQNFHDLKEAHGTVPQHLPNYCPNIPAYHLTLWP